MRNGWEFVPLGKYIKQSKKKIKVVDGEEYPAIGVMMEGRGFVTRPPFIGGKTTYKQLTPIEPDQLVLRSITAWEAPIQVTTKEHSGFHVSGVFPVFDIDVKNLNPQYLSLLCRYNPFWESMRERTVGSVLRRKTLSATALMDIPVHLPPLPEQKRIVDLISSVDSYIEALQKQLESAKRSKNALVESQILELSDSSLATLKNLSTKIGSGATPRGGEEVYIENGVNLIRSQNVHDSKFVMRGLVAIEDSAAKALENVTVEEGDVLINITGASVTRCCVVDSTILPARVNQHVAIIRSNRAKILPKYLVLVLTSNEVKGFLNDIAGTGSTRQALTKTHLEDLEIPVPNISKQTKIIENSDAFDIVILKSQIALDRIIVLRSGLLSDLLSGIHEIPTTYDKVIGAA